MFSNTTGNYNTATGYQALYTSTTADNNTAFGVNAGYSNVTGDRLALFGGSAGYNSTGFGNTCFGYSAGSNITSGTGNLCLGGYSVVNANTDSYSVVIGWNRSGKGGSTAILGGGDGGTSGVYQGNNSSSWTTTSDRRLKKNIVDNTVGLSAITQLRVRNFEYRLPNEVDPELNPIDAIPNTGVQLGVIAQELNEVLPDCVKTETTGVMSVDSTNITWYMINAIKELKTLVDAQSALITGQAAEIVALKAKVGL